jgi:hypothetical protein
VPVPISIATLQRERYTNWFEFDGTFPHIREPDLAAREAGALQPVDHDR